jgi:hypothetical protein
MPKGRSKGFGHYMCKKFFHPGNPENLERVFIGSCPYSKVFSMA